MSETTHTPEPWQIGTSCGGVMTVVCKDAQRASATAIAFAVCREVKSVQKGIKQAEANTRLIALAPTMKKALLKVRQLKHLGTQIPTCRHGTPDYANLLKKGQLLEAEINTVIDQIEAGQ